jgi:PhzF family phenazine biosynthesis protein
MTEVALCGHATLASAFVLQVCRNWPEDTIRFQTRKSGQLVVTRRHDFFDMDFPARHANAQSIPVGLKAALGVEPEKALVSTEDLMVVLGSEGVVRQVRPDFTALEQIACRGIIITAKGDRSDFVSRFFAPRVGIKEDPVTGSAHCVLIPYWAAALGKNDLHALQVSKRGGELFCKQAGERVIISGKAALYLEGTITV